MSGLWPSPSPAHTLQKWPSFVAGMPAATLDEWRGGCRADRSLLPSIAAGIPEFAGLARVQAHPSEIIRFRTQNCKLRRMIDLPRIGPAMATRVLPLYRRWALNKIFRPAIRISAHEVLGFDIHFRPLFVSVRHNRAAISPRDRLGSSPWFSSCTTAPGEN